MNKTAGGATLDSPSQEGRRSGNKGGGGEQLDTSVIKVKGGRKNTGERRDRTRREETKERTEVGRKGEKRRRVGRDGKDRAREELRKRRGGQKECYAQASQEVSPAKTEMTFEGLID